MGIAQPERTLRAAKHTLPGKREQSPRLVDKEPDDAGNHIRQNERHEENHAKNRPARQRFANEQGQHQSNRQLYTERKYQNDQIVPDRFQKGRISERNGKIAQPDEIRERPQATPGPETIEESLDDRK